MNPNNTCSLIEDLLPLYVEDMVTETSKKEIEEHLKECDRCSEILRSIKEENKFFTNEELFERETNDNREKEIKCIKNIKRKIVINIIITMLITAITIIAIFCIYILSPYRFIKNEDGKLILYNFDTGNIKQGIDSTNMIATYTLDDNGKEIEYNIIFTFNKNDVCINARTVISGYNEKELNNYKTVWEDSLSSSNMKIENQKLYMNENSYIGKTKQKIYESLKEYQAQIIER